MSKSKWLFRSATVEVRISEPSRGTVSSSPLNLNFDCLQSCSRIDTQWAKSRSWNTKAHWSAGVKGVEGGWNEWARSQKEKNIIEDEDAEAIEKKNEMIRKEKKWNEREMNSHQAKGSESLFWERGGILVRKCTRECERRSRSRREWFDIADEALSARKLMSTSKALRNRKV